MVGGIALVSLHDARTALDAVFIAVAIGLPLIVALLALGLRATAIRPLHRLAAQVRRWPAVTSSTRSPCAARGR